jgi:hypothetical protein
MMPKEVQTNLQMRRMGPLEAVNRPHGPLSVAVSSSVVHLNMVM